MDRRIIFNDNRRIRRRGKFAALSIPPEFEYGSYCEIIPQLRHKILQPSPTYTALSQGNFAMITTLCCVLQDNVSPSSGVNFLQLEKQLEVKYGGFVAALKMRHLICPPRMSKVGIPTFNTPCRKINCSMARCKAIFPTLFSH